MCIFSGVASGNQQCGHAYASLFFPHQHILFSICSSNENPAFQDKAKEVLESLVESLDHLNVEVLCNPYPVS